MISAELVTIGAELLQGRVLNTNAQFLSRELTLRNFSVNHHQICNDSKEDIEDALGVALERADLVIATGGLGPTPDDITREAVADFFHSKLIFHEKQHAHIVQFFKKLGKRPSPITKKECYFPKIGKPILNQYGIALGFYIIKKHKILVCLPGVPRELINLFDAHVTSILSNHFGATQKIHELNISLMGMDEARAMRIFGRFHFDLSQFSFGSYPSEGRLVFRFRAKSLKMIQKLKAMMRIKFGYYIYSFEDLPIERTVADWAIRKHKTIALAESCTGGLLSKRLTDSSGASKFFLGSITAYSNQVKKSLLGINQHELSKFGAVSREIAKKMAIHVRILLKADIAISITGIAGPQGGTKRKPVGLVWFGISTIRKTITFQERYIGNRDCIRRAAADKALWLLYKHLT